MIENLIIGISMIPAALIAASIIEGIKHCRVHG